MKDPKPPGAGSVLVLLYIVVICFFFFPPAWIWSLPPWVLLVAGLAFVLALGWALLVSFVGIVEALGDIFMGRHDD